jgi:pimeloyl-ACP methyl ester carboxylesterase
MDVTARVLHFGPEGALMGVLASPDEPRDGAPAVVLINSGLIHRVGPNRLYVRLAQELAERGFHSLRFDLSGIGDSPSLGAGDGLSVQDRAEADIVSATLAVRESVGVDRFVLMGLCSGAFMAHRTAGRHEMVVGCIQFDGYIYATRGFYLRNYARKLVSPAAWLRVLGRSLRHPEAATAGPEQDTAFTLEALPRATFESDVAHMVRRGMKMLFVITQGGLQEVNYRRQLHDSVPGVDLERCAHVLHFPEADHTLTLRRHRDEVVEATAAWMHRSFPPVDPGPPADARRASAT